MAAIDMPLRYIFTTSVRWDSVRISCFLVILLANLVPSSYGYLLPGLSMGSSPLLSRSNVETRQAKAALTFFKFSVDKGPPVNCNHGKHIIIITIWVSA